MKKVSSLLMVLALLVSFAACSAEKGPQNLSEQVESGTTKAENQAIAEVLPQLVVEDFEVTRYEKDELGFKIKFRNISDVDLETFTFLYQILDANGDILYDTNAGGHSVDAGQAIWTGPWSSVGSIPVADVAAIAIKSSTHSTKENTIAEKRTFEIPSGQPLDSDEKTSDNTQVFTQFRDYLKERGPVTVVTNHEYGQNKITIEENAGTIQISRVGEGYDENGNRRETSGSTSHIWDIQNYHSGDEISFIMDYSELDNNGNYIQKTGTMTGTKAYAEVADVLSQTLAESGLDVTMADMGFPNY